MIHHLTPVSYTHLDVYKRQTFAFAMKGTSYRMKQAQKSYETLKDLLLSEETIGKDRNTNENDQNL